MEENVRRRRVDVDGEWEYECNVCENWLPKKKFRGCKNYVDGYGNCLMCSSCRAKTANKMVRTRDEENAEEILQLIGFRDYPNQEAWYEEMKRKHNIK